MEAETSVLEPLKNPYLDDQDLVCYSLISGDTDENSTQFTQCLDSTVMWCDETNESSNSEILKSSLPVVESKPPDEFILLNDNFNVNLSTNIPDLPRLDESLAYYSIVCQEWLNEFRFPAHEFTFEQPTTQPSSRLGSKTVNTIRRPSLCSETVVRPEHLLMSVEDECDGDEAEISSKVETSSKKVNDAISESAVRKNISAETPQFLTETPYAKKSCQPTEMNRKFLDREKPCLDMTYSLDTPPSTPSDASSSSEPAILIEAFQKYGVRSSCSYHLKLGLTGISPASLTCLTCDIKPVQTLNSLAKHIEANHAKKDYVCLLCKLDDKGFGRRFATTTEAFVHGMENHNTSEFKYFLCAFCQILVLGEGNFDVHLRQVHPNESLTESLFSLRRFPCLLCLFPFKHMGHRVDHFKANHKMDIKAYFCRRPKKKVMKNLVCSPTSTLSLPPVDESLSMVSSAEEKRILREMLKETKTELVNQRKEERLKRKQAVEEERLEKLARLKNATDLKVEPSPSPPPRVNPDSITTGRKTLRPDLKDRYSDLLENQPRVVVTDFMHDFFTGSEDDYHVWDFIDRCQQQPRVLVESKSKT